MSNEVTTTTNSQLPTYNEDGLNIILRETARANPLLRFKEGKFLIGEDEIELGREYIAHVLDWTRGWVRWEDGVIVETRMARVMDDTKLPAREELGYDDKSQWEDEEKDPWVFQNILPIEDLETSEYMLFASSSIGGRIAVEKLCNSVARTYKAGSKYGLPVIALDTTPFTTKFGTKPRPHFPIVRWRDLPPHAEDMSDSIPF
jgi:hypothetical protein